MIGYQLSSSIETGPLEMQSYQSRGSSCYLLFDDDNKASYFFSRAKLLTANYGEPMDFRLGTVLPCISNGVVSLEVGKYTLPLKKLSNDPSYILEKPLEWPPPGLYVNDGRIPDAFLDHVVVELGEAGRFSLSFVLRNHRALKYTGAATEGSQTKGCFGVKDEEKSMEQRRLFSGYGGMPRGHFVRYLTPKDVGICRTLESQIYLALDTFFIPLKPGQPNPEKASDIPKLPEGAISAAKRHGSSLSSGLGDSTAAKKQAFGRMTVRGVERVGDHPASGSRLITALSADRSSADAKQSGLASELEVSQSKPINLRFSKSEDEGDQSTATRGASTDSASQSKVDQVGYILDWVRQLPDELLDQPA
ncbi:hypothetical protein FOZ60_003400 [Perkinsus olseni]|uniref:Uncharacterized protein n=1 Tax=Perkinsus olseni TaxID=32597 RepID=A0A7J6PI40_PEROL|nr:hypothetical protein FOZ60_003400 [Perkinsus olseni]